MVLVLEILPVDLEGYFHADAWLLFENCFPALSAPFLRYATRCVRFSVSCSRDAADSVEAASFRLLFLAGWVKRPNFRDTLRKGEWLQHCENQRDDRRDGRLVPSRHTPSCMRSLGVVGIPRSFRTHCDVTKSTACAPIILGQ